MYVKLCSSTVLRTLHLSKHLIDQKILKFMKNASNKMFDTFGLGVTIGHNISVSMLSCIIVSINPKILRKSA